MAQTSSATAEVGRPVGWRVVLVLTALVAFGPLSTDMYLPALPGLGRSLGAGMGTAQLTLSVFMVGFAVGQLAFGPLSDRFGRRPVVASGILLFVAASLACAAAPTIEALIAARFLQALGACSGPVLGRAMVRDLVARSEAARILGLMSTAMSLAPAVAPAIGAWLAAAAGWPSIFLALAGFGALILAATLAVVGETNRRLDRSALAPAALLANYAALVRHRAYLGYSLSVAAAYGALFAFLSGSSFVLIDWYGVPPAWFGPMFALVCLGYMIGGLLTSRLTRRTGIDRLIRAGQAVQVAAAGAMVLLTVGDPAGGFGLGGFAVVLPTMAVMIGTGLIMPNGFAGALEPFPHIAGAASSLLGFAQMVGAAVVGVAVGQLSQGSGVVMALSMLTVAAAGAAAFRWLVPRA